MNRILLGIDGSPESIKAASLARRLAKETSAHLTIVHVLTPPWDTPAAAEAETLVALMAAQKKVGHELLSHAAHQARQEGLQVEAMLRSGPPAETLAELAENGQVDLVVVGHRGRGAVARLLLGSVADRLVQLCPKAVLVAR